MVAIEKCAIFLYPLCNWSHSWIDTPHKLGQRLLEKVLSSDTPVRINPQFEDICVYTFAVLLEELQCLPDCEHQLHCDLAVAAYVSLSRTIGANSKNVVTSLSEVGFTVVYQAGES